MTDSSRPAPPISQPRGGENTDMRSPNGTLMHSDVPASRTESKRLLFVPPTDDDDSHRLLDARMAHKWRICVSKRLQIGIGTRRAPGRCRGWMNLSFYCSSLDGASTSRVCAGSLSLSQTCPLNTLHGISEAL